MMPQGAQVRKKPGKTDGLTADPLDLAAAGAKLFLQPLEAADQVPYGALELLASLLVLLPADAGFVIVLLLHRHSAIAVSCTTSCASSTRGTRVTIVRKISRSCRRKSLKNSS